MKHVSPLSPSKYNECISEWLSWVKSHTTHQIRRLLNLTVSLKSIHLLKDSVQVNLIFIYSFGLLLIF